MTNKNRTADFNLFLASDITFGALEAIYEKLGDVPTREPARAEWINAMTGLAWAGLKAARETNAFLYAASDRHRFPKSYAEVDSGYEGVKEQPAIYAVK